MAMMDEARIAEIVERVVERLAGGVSSAPVRSAAPVADGSTKNLGIPAANLGIHDDPEAALRIPQPTSCP